MIYLIGETDKHAPNYEPDTLGNVSGPYDLTLTPSGMAVHQASRTAFVADLHLGKAIALQRQGVPLPKPVEEGTLRCLDGDLAAHGIAHLFVLGDLGHGRIESWEFVREWRTRHCDITMTLVEGNHDRKAAIEASAIGFEQWPPGKSWHGVRLFHEPPDTPGPALAGHVHPGIRLEGRGRQSLRLPCFWLSGAVLILPAYGEMTGLAMVSPADGDRVFAIVGNRILEVQVGEGEIRDLQC